MEKSVIDTINQQIEEGRLEQARELILHIDESDIALKEFFSGKICYKLQKWGDALNHFYKVEDLEQNNIAAKNYISLISGILEYHNKDIYNP